MRAHVLVLLLLVAQQCAARHLRQLTVQCPEELTKPVLAYMNSAKYKDAVAKACAKRKLLSACMHLLAQLLLLLPADWLAFVF